MTTLYREVLIESADLPMHKFPEGTIATHPDYWPVERCSCSRWESEGPDRYDPDMIGWTALVPVEAEEEHKGIPVLPRPVDAPWPPRSTPNQDVDGLWYYIDEDGYSTAHLGGHSFHDLMVAWIDSLPRATRYVTPWTKEEA